MAFDDRLRARWRLVAKAWWISAMVAFGIGAVAVGIPVSPESLGYERPAQLALFAIGGLGGLIALRRARAGGTVLTAAALILGVLAALQYHPLVALLVFIAFVGPGVAWLMSSFSTIRQLRVFGAVFAILSIAGGWAALSVSSAYFGPTHPASTTELGPVDLVEWAWAGSATPESITVVARLRGDGPASMYVSSIESSLVVDGVSVDDTGQVFRFDVTGLSADTVYSYQLARDDHIDESRTGRFRTFPDGPSTFTIAFSSCAITGSNGSVFDAIRAHEPLLYLIGGDMHYSNIERNDVDLFRKAYERALTAPAQSALVRSTAIAYVWDDHDYGPNDSDRFSPSRDASRQAYGAYVPHYPLEASTIQQSFSIGRVWFLLTDSRSERDPAAGTMLGSAQRSWLEEQMLAHRDAPLVVWVNTVPWIAEVGGDGWGEFASEREELADFLADNDIDNVVMLSGDAHMLAIDDGTNSGYSTEQTAGFPVMHAAALDRPGGLKGGPYSEGEYPGGGQYGLMRVIDDGGEHVTVEWSGLTWDGRELVRLEFTMPSR